MKKRFLSLVAFVLLLTLSVSLVSCFFNTAIVLSLFVAVL